jgi:predicted dehydrogenase
MEQAVRIAQQGKHILLGKLISIIYKDALNIIDICEENNVKLAVVHPRRLDLTWRNMYKYLKK